MDSYDFITVFDSIETCGTDMNHYKRKERGGA